MSQFAIITDSCADLTGVQADQLQVEVLPLSFIMDGVSRHNWPDNREMSSEDFFAALRNGVMPTTSAVNVDQYLTAMEPLLADGKDVLILSFASALSATYQAGKIAADELAEKYPDRKIYSVDTLCASVGVAQLVWKAAEMRQAGATIDAVHDWVLANRDSVCQWITVDDLNHLKRGGRVSAATAMVGTMLRVKPILHVDGEGKLLSVEKARGRSGAFQTLVKHYQDTVLDVTDRVMIVHGDCLDDAQKVADQLKSDCGATNVVINSIGPVIGSHTGPGMVGVFFFGSER